MPMTKNIVRFVVVGLLATALLLYVRFNQNQNLTVQKVRPVECIHNLQQIGIAFRIWQGEHDDKMPFAISTNSGGTLELCTSDKDGFDFSSYLHLKAIYKDGELRTPLVLVCPQDKSKKPAKDFEGISAENVTYRIRSVLNGGSQLEILAICPIDGNVLYTDGTVKESHPKPIVPGEPRPMRLENQTKAPLETSVHTGIKLRYSEFTPEEKAAFASNFNSRYKSAVSNWCHAYGDHTPISPDAITEDKFVERIGRKPATYGEYIFVVDGITLGVRDVNGVAKVGYLNNGSQTAKMAMLPNGGEAPKINGPVTKQEVIAMLATDGGTQFLPGDVRMVPSGFSGALNGGTMVHVGGDPENAASWKYDMVFGADGKLVYYLAGQK